MNSYNGFSSNVRAKVGNIQLKAIKSGKFPKPAQCELCLSTDGQMQLHNEDYSKPFADAHPICRACHLALHIRFTNPDRWRKRKAVIKERRIVAGEEIGSNWWDHLINQPIVMHESLSEFKKNYWGEDNSTEVMFHPANTLPNIHYFSQRSIMFS